MITCIVEIRDIHAYFTNTHSPIVYGDQGGAAVKTLQTSVPATAFTGGKHGLSTQLSLQFSYKLT